MARRKRYGDMVALPLGDLVKDVTGSVKGTDVLVGGLLGIAGVGAFNWLSNQSWFPATLKTNATFMRFKPLAVGALAGAAVYFGEPKLMKGASHRAAGHAAGIVGAAIAIQAMQEAKAWKPSLFADVVDLRLAGLIVNDTYRRQGMNGYGSFLINDPARPFAGMGGYADNPRLAELAALDMGLQEDDPDMADIGLDA